MYNNSGKIRIADKACHSILIKCQHKFYRRGRTDSLKKSVEHFMNQMKSLLTTKLDLLDRKILRQISFSVAHHFLNNITDFSLLEYLL